MEKKQLPFPVKKAAGDEEGQLEIDPHDELHFRERTRVVQEWKARGENPYPHQFKASCSLAEFIAKYSESIETEPCGKESVSITGRLHAKHLDNANDTAEYELRGRAARIAIKADAEHYKDVQSFKQINKKLHRGDFVGVTGHPGKSSESGELYIAPTSMQLLVPCLRQIPDAFGGKDLEARRRQRYLDLMTDENGLQTFVVRARIISLIRQFLESLGFLEVETPIMCPSAPGGAIAQSFTTHHNRTGKDLFLRVAPEFYHKMLLVGGADRVYEIGKLFRDDPIDDTHNPEFTSCEFYMAYADYEDLMTIAEDMLSGAGVLQPHYAPFPSTTQPTNNTLPERCTFPRRYEPNGRGAGVVWNVDFTPPFKRIKMMPELERALAQKLPEPDALHSEESRTLLDDLCERHDAECPPPRTVARLLGALVGKFIESKCINPTFIIEHPQIMSPLSKGHRSLPGLTERFELFACRMELVNAYTDVNDPVEQRQNFAQEAKHKSEGDEEAMMIDEEFCTALEYGFPPTAGWGMGVDRLTMIATNHSSIRVNSLLFRLGSAEEGQDVVFFPAMKPAAPKRESADSNGVE